MNYNKLFNNVQILYYGWDMRDSPIKSCVCMSSVRISFLLSGLNSPILKGTFPEQVKNWIDLVPLEL